MKQQFFPPFHGGPLDPHCNRANPFQGMDISLIGKMAEAAKSDESFALDNLMSFFSDLCGSAEKPVVLMIDEIDSAANNQVFLDFLAQLRAYYLTRDEMPTFQSVILAGVTDIRIFSLTGKQFPILPLTPA